MYRPTIDMIYVVSWWVTVPKLNRIQLSNGSWMRASWNKGTRATQRGNMTQPNQHRQLSRECFIFLCVLILLSLVFMGNELLTFSLVVKESWKLAFKTLWNTLWICSYMEQCGGTHSPVDSQHRTWAMECDRTKKNFYSTNSMAFPPFFFSFCFFLRFLICFSCGFFSFFLYRDF